MPSTDRPQSVLVVEDDRNICRLLATYLTRDGFDVQFAGDGSSALARFEQADPDLIILDVMLPELDGWEVCRRIRKESDVPVIMVTARGQETDRIKGFTLGVDDYVVKPFSPAEIVERVKAVLRRTQGRPRHSDSVLICGELTLDTAGHHLTLRGSAIPLTPSEFRLMKALMSRPGRVLSREELLNVVHPEGDPVIDRTVDVHIGNLRRKIEATPAEPSYIRTVRGTGYKMVNPDEE
jgi:DNA-binding response OmpR family regulator